MVGRICERGRPRFSAGSERVKELWMLRVMNLWKKLNWYVWEDQSPRWRDLHKAVGEKQGVDSRVEVRHRAPLPFDQYRLAL